MGARIMLAVVGVLGLCAGLWAGLSGAAQLQNAGKQEGQGGVSLVVLFGVFTGLVTLVAALWFVFAFADSDPAGRTAMLKGLRSFALLFLAMLAGMIASVLVANGRAGRLEISVAQLVVPLTCSVLVFGAFWGGLSGRTAGPIELLAAFESGFGWEAFINRIEIGNLPASALKKPVGRGGAVAG